MLKPIRRSCGIPGSICRDFDCRTRTAKRTHAYVVPKWAAAPQQTTGANLMRSLFGDCGDLQRFPALRHPARYTISGFGALESVFALRFVILFIALRPRFEIV